MVIYFDHMVLYDVNVMKYQIYNVIHLVYMYTWFNFVTFSYWSDIEYQRLSHEILFTQLFAPWQQMVKAL